MKRATIACWVLLMGCTAQTTTPSGGGAAPASGGDNGSASGAASTVATGDCIDRCAVAVEKCGATPDQASQACVDECTAASSVTEAQVACLEAKKCAELAEAPTLLCAAAAPSGGRTPNNNNPGSNNPSNAKPSTLTITGSFGSTKAIHVNGSGNKVASNISIAPTPTFSPSKPSEMPKISEATFTVQSPSLGTCEPDIKFTLNAEQVGVVVTGSDALPSVACAKFTDAIAENGLKVKITGAPYPNGGSATVTLNLTP